MLGQEAVACRRTAQPSGCRGRDREQGEVEDGEPEHERQRQSPDAGGSVMADRGVGEVHLEHRELPVGAAGDRDVDLDTRYPWPAGVIGVSIDSGEDGDDASVAGIEGFIVWL